jgi:hypothetical protein
MQVFGQEGRGLERPKRTGPHTTHPRPTHKGVQAQRLAEARHSGMAAAPAQANWLLLTIPAGVSSTAACRRLLRHG